MGFRPAPLLLLSSSLLSPLSSLLSPLSPLSLFFGGSPVRVGLVAVITIALFLRHPGNFLLVGVFVHLGASWRYVAPGAQWVGPDIIVFRTTRGALRSGQTRHAQ